MRLRERRSAKENETERGMIFLASSKEKEREMTLSVLLLLISALSAFYYPLEKRTRKALFTRGEGGGFTT